MSNIFDFPSVFSFAIVAFGITYPRFLFTVHKKKSLEFHSERATFAGDRDRGQLNPVFFLTLYYCEVNFNIIFRLRLCLQNGLFPSGYPATVLYVMKL
jgi:hypothetical protein